MYHCSLALTEVQPESSFVPLGGRLFEAPGGLLLALPERSSEGSTFGSRGACWDPCAKNLSMASLLTTAPFAQTFPLRKLGRCPASYKCFMYGATRFFSVRSRVLRSSIIRKGGRGSWRDARITWARTSRLYNLAIMDHGPNYTGDIYTGHFYTDKFTPGFFTPEKFTPDLISTRQFYTRQLYTGLFYTGHIYTRTHFHPVIFLPGHFYTGHFYTISSTVRAIYQTADL